MVRLHSVTLDFVQHCIEKYEKDNPGDVVRIFDPMPNSNNIRHPSVLVWNPIVDSDTVLYCPLTDHRMSPLKQMNTWTYGSNDRNGQDPFFVYDIGRNILVVSAQLECNICSEPYTSHHPHILRQIKFSLPFYRAYKIGITSGLHDLIIKSIEGGMFFQAIEKMLKKLLEARYGSGTSEDQLTFKSISRRDITKIFLEDFEAKKAFYDVTMRMLKSSELSTDNTFKSIKGVAVRDGKRILKQFGSICLVLNQDGLIVGRKSVSGSSLSGARDIFEELSINNEKIVRIDTGEKRIYMTNRQPYRTNTCVCLKLRPR